MGMLPKVPPTRSYETFVQWYAAQGAQEHGTRDRFYDHAQLDGGDYRMFATSIGAAIDTDDVGGVGDDSICSLFCGRLRNDDPLPMTRTGSSGILDDTLNTVYHASRLGNNSIYPSNFPLAIDHGHYKHKLRAMRHQTWLTSYEVHSRTGPTVFMNATWGFSHG